MAITNAREAAEVADKRWRKPENVQRRVDALAATIRRKASTLPVLTEEQAAALRMSLDEVIATAPTPSPEVAERLAALLPPTSTGDGGEVRAA